MSSFLQLVAQDLLRRFPDGMQDVTVVFPGKRAQLFLNQHLYDEAGHPVWAPSYCSIRELFTALSPYALIDRIEAICLLYKVYMRHLPPSTQAEGKTASLDHFYSWGEVLLADFDDIDKNMVRADLLFSNIEDLELLTSTNYLSPEQERTLQRFFATFDKATNDDIRDRFRRMWRAMPQIYSDFNAEMRRMGRLTEGALFRDVVENQLPTLSSQFSSELCSSRKRTLNSQLSTPTYAFVGLNALSRVEERLLQYLQSEQRAIFYWDYDDAYMKDGFEASLFMRRNLQLFRPNAIDRRQFNNLSSPDKRFTYVATAGSNVQARYIPTWLDETRARQPKSLDPQQCLTATPDTAIVLCDESMLEGVLHSIPDSGVCANITMGFPLVSTPVYGMVKALLALHIDGWNRQAGRARPFERRVVANHPLLRRDVAEGVLDIDVHEEGCLWLVRYVKGVVSFVVGRLDEAAHDAVSGGETGDAAHGAGEGVSAPEDILLHESLFKVYTVLSTFERLIDDGTLQVEAPRLAGIIDQELKRASIPFSGEPAQGLQIMGMLETRCLDFDNILMLAVGEGKMPNGGSVSSFIPYSLRQPFQLTTIEHRVAIQAYNFYRLLQRARNVTFVYDTSNSDGVKNEMSRFLRQMLVEMRPGGSFPDKAITLKPAISLPHPRQLLAEKTPLVLGHLMQHNYFSPTALECYIQCPLKYYLQYVARVREYEEADEEMDAATFGNIFHGSAEDIYSARELHEQYGGRLTASYIDGFLKGVRGEAALQAVVDANFNKYYFSKRNLPPNYGNGSLIIRRDVVVGYLKSLLMHDLRSIAEGTRQVIACEREVKYSLITPAGHTINAKIKIDRIDLVDDSYGRRLQVIDYKTMSRGSSKPSAKLSLDDVMEQDAKYIKHIFQTFIYSLCVIGDKSLVPAEEPLPVQPLVFYTQDASRPGYSPHITFDNGVLTDFRPYADGFRERLAALIGQVLDPDVPFMPADKSDNCAYCPFADICRR